MTIDQSQQARSVVLLVEDDPLEVRLVKAALARTPIEITLIHVQDGDEAVDYLSGVAPFNDREKYPLPITVLLDLKLPKRNGLEVLRWLRSQESPIRRMPAIMLTASRQRADINTAFEIGANAYFTKPESMKDLTLLLDYFKKFWLQLIEFPDLEAPHTSSSF